MPGDVGRAIGFWSGWSERELQDLATERLDLVDSFVRALRRVPDGDDELAEDVSLLDRLQNLVAEAQAALDAPPQTG
jgi:hypothetical protein